ncbi:MAG: hypothetical protein KA205_01675, partial [Acidobacteria bacterium]|nr:hypothetical protein [Acidobacteriota bacterium]
TRPSPIRADVREVVLRDAADVAARIDAPALFPARRVALALAAASALWIALFVTDARWMARARDLVASTVTGEPSIGRVQVTITPPAYSGRAPQTVIDPERIDALAGSRIHVEVDATAAHVDLMGVGERHALARDGRVFRGDVTATADGFLAVQPFGEGDAAGVRRVMSLAVTPDRAPAARIVAPGKDLFLSVATATLPVRIEASDDIGLASLRLTYTKVTGSGESFEFANGEFPLQITRGQPQAWTATSSIPLSRLGLEAGDVLVYRAVVGDTRPGSEPIDSDAFVIEIVRPGEALAEGFSIDEEKDKYAISQQMVIIKTERLLAKKATISAEAFADEAQNIAAEQRKVRSEFVFMMGGEFEDAAAEPGGDINEEEEAANEVELMSGRMQNNGRRDIIQATRYMSDAVLLLTNLNAKDALPREKAALVSLQRAFTKSRYILRVLTPRERIDDSRRLSGKLGEVSPWRRVVADVPNDPRSTALLNALASVGRVAGLTSYSSADANQLAGIAETILRADSTLAVVAQAFAQAGASIAQSKPARETATLIDAAAAKLAAAAGPALPPAPAPTAASRARLQGALADAAKRGGGRR